MTNGSSAAFAKCERAVAHVRGSYVPILLKKSFLGDERNFLGPLMRFVRGKNDYGPSYRRHRALQRQRRLKISFREIFGIVRFSTFATWGNSGIEPDKGKGISSPGTYEATMLSGSPASCRRVWFKEVHVKDIDSHSVRALLASRALLVKIKRDLENHVRGLLKNLGLVIGRAKFNVFAVRAEELIEGRPELIAAIRPLLEARNAVGRQVSELDRKVMKLARHDAQVRRFMTAPGVGPITALAFKATIDDPARFARSRSVGA